MPDIKLLPNTLNYTLLSRLSEILESVTKMKMSFGDRKKRSALRFSVLMLLGHSLSGCALPVSPPPKANASREAHANAQPVRAIIYFQQPTTDNKLLSDAISGACRCLPVFLRSYGKDALIYGITLAPGQNFNTFEKALMQNSPRIGIRQVEQDSLEQREK